MSDKINWTPILVGVGIAGAAGLILYYSLRKKTGNIAAFYVSDMDLQAAQIVKNEAGGILLRGKNIGEGGTSAEALAKIAGYNITISIGGQMTNPLYAYALQQGLVKELLAPGDKEVKRVMISNKDIIFAAGYNAIDTVNAVYEAVALI